MLGTVVALRNDGHMRLTTLVDWVRPSLGRWFSSVGALVVIAFVLLILMPALTYIDEQQYTELTTLGISDGYRVVAILFGMSLAAIIAVLRLIETTTWRDFGLARAGGRRRRLRAVAVSAATDGDGVRQPVRVLRRAGRAPAWRSACRSVSPSASPRMSYLALTTDMPLSVVVNRMDDGMSNLLLLSVPMFVFLGLLMEMTGIARVMVAFLAALVGHVRGGLSYVLLGAMYLVSGISGSKAADMAAVAPVLFPEMRRRGAASGRAGLAAGDLQRDVGDDPAESWC